MKKTLLVTFCLATAVIISLGFIKADPPEFKNLKVLPKDISEKSLDSIMHFFNVSLGVRCNFCHVRNEELKKMNFASDDKPEKEVARKMMLMTMAINKKYFTQEEEKGNNQQNIDAITCYSCHHGAEMPASIPAMQNENKGWGGNDQRKPPMDSTKKN